MAQSDRAPPAENRSQKRRNPKGKKARKAAARKAAVAVSPRTANLRGRKQRAPDPVSDQIPLASPAAASPATPVTAPAMHPVSEVQADALLDLCLQAEPALALLLPARPEPLVETPALTAEAGAAEIAPDAVRVLDMAAMQELLVASPPAEAAIQPSVTAETAPALTLPHLPEPLARSHAPVADPAPLLRNAEPAPALTALADAQSGPLPRSRALVPVRRQGLVDVIAFMLRDSGRRLARWSARRQKTRAEQDALRRAQLRQMALANELAALEALRQNQHQKRR